MTSYLLMAALLALVAGAAFRIRRRPRSRGLRAPDRGIAGEAGRAVGDMAEAFLGLSERNQRNRRRR